MKILIYIFCILGIALITSCNSSSVVTRTTAPNKSDATHVDTKNLQNLALVDYLRRIPGVLISGSGNNIRVMVRGINSFEGTNSPLFVIDNNPVGQNYQQAASLVDPNDIAYVRLMKDPVTTSAYGLRATNGVIFIKTKKKKDKVNS